MHRKHKLSKRLPGLSLLNGNKAVFSVCLYVACQTIIVSFTWLKIITNKHNDPFWWLEATQFVKYSKQEYGQEKRREGGKVLPSSMCADLTGIQLIFSESMSFVTVSAARKAKSSASLPPAVLLLSLVKNKVTVDHPTWSSQTPPPHRAAHTF